MNTETVSKLEAAEAQLVTAIRLFFRGNDDEIAIHTLTRASYEILDKLCGRKNLSRGVMHEGLTQFVKPKFHKEVIRKVNEAKNYFKHADTDVEETLYWNPKVSEYFIWDAVMLHRRLSESLRIKEFMVFSMWFRIHHNDLWDQNESIEKFIPDVEVIKNLSKNEFYEYSEEAYKTGLFPAIKF